MEQKRNRASSNWNRFRVKARYRANRRRAVVTRGVAPNIYGGGIPYNSLRSSSFPSRRILNLKYVAKNETNIAGMAHNTHVWNMNDMYDVDHTSIGHQPLGFDQWANFYLRYRVIRASYVLKFTGFVGSAPIDVVAVPVSHSAAVPSSDDYQYLCEQPGARYVTVHHSPDHVSLSNRFYMPALAGVTSSVYKTDLGFSGAYNGHPANVLKLFTVFTTREPAWYSYTITFNFVVEFFEPKTLPGS